jgi:hypothetical protein
VPFTGSHPAAVLPLLGVRRAGFVPSALVIGSMAPDIPYYLVIPFRRELTHSLLGVVTVDLVLGLLAFALWQSLLAPAAIAIAPAGLRARLRQDQPAGLRHHLDRPAGWWQVALSLCAGALTHVVWDSFTHSGTWAPEHITWLAETYGPLPGYRYAQYASGVIGGAVIAVYLWRWWRATPVHADADPGHRTPGVVAVGVWTAVVVAAMVAAVVAALVPLTDAAGPDYRRAVFLAATRGAAGGGVILLAFAAWWAVRRRRRP